MKEGQILICHKVCFNGQSTTTVGNKYTIIKIFQDKLYQNKFMIINDQGRNHYFSLDVKNNSYYIKWFQDEIKITRRKKLNKILNAK